VKTNILLVVQPAPGAGGASGGGPLDFLRTNPQFIALRQIVQSNPMILQPMLQVRMSAIVLQKEHKSSEGFQHVKQHGLQLRTTSWQI